MSHSLKQLRDMSIIELIDEHDRLAVSTQVGINYYLEELSRRDQDKQTDRMLTYTKSILVLTVIVTVATMVNVAIAYSLMYA